MINTPNFRQNLQSLYRNTVNNSSTFNGYLAILEGAEGTIANREKINNFLISLITKNKKNNTNILESLGSLKEKIAFIATLNGDNTNNVINYIYENILKELDLSESTVIRLSALNRFKINISPEQNIKLVKIETELIKIINKKIPDLVKNFHINNRTVAQRIQKIKEITNYLIKKGIIQEFPEGYEEIIDLLKPLYELDKDYHILNHARNNFYDIQRLYGEVKNLSFNEIKILEKALGLITGNNTTLEKFYNDNLKNNLENIDLESILKNILSNCSDVEEKLKTLNLSISDFERYFLYYFSIEILYKSKINLDKRKKEIFKDEKKDFELDIKKYREIQRNRLLELCQIGDLQQVENIFERDRKLFLRTGDTNKDQILQTTLEKVLKKRYPNTDVNILIQLAQAIMDENEVTNELYYGNKNYFQNDSEDTGLQKLVKSIGNTGRNIQKIGNFTTPIIGGFVKLTQKTIELLGRTTSGIINGTTSQVKSIIDKYNSWANTPAKGFFGSVAKFPFKASQIITRPLGWGASSIHFITSKTTEVISNSYNGINDAIKKASDQEIDNLFDVFTKIYKHRINLLGAGTSWSGDKAFNMLKTQQKREILKEFYKSKSHSEVSALLEAIDIQSVLKDSSPYIFDDNYIEDLGYNHDDNYIEDLGYNQNISEDLEIFDKFDKKVSNILLDIESLKEKDIYTYEILKNSFSQIKREINSDEVNENKLMSISSIIYNLLIKLINYFNSLKTPEDEKIKILINNLGINVSGIIGAISINNLGINVSGILTNNSFLYHLQNISESINKDGSFKDKKLFKESITKLTI